MKKDFKTIYLDFDGVICDTIKAIVSLYNEDFRYYKKFRKIEDCDINTWGFIECNCASPEYINTYFNQPRFFKRLEFMPWAYEVITELMKKYNIKIVSHGYSPNLIQKKKWVNSHLPGIEFIGVNWKEYSDKSHIDMSDGIFFDDSAKNLENSNAKEVICFGDVYSWNNYWNGKRISNWIDLQEYLLGYRKIYLKF